MKHTIGNVAPAGILREGNPEGRLHTRQLQWDEAQWDDGSLVQHLILLFFPETLMRDAKAILQCFVPYDSPLYGAESHDSL